jgi:hypothetical protein
MPGDQTNRARKILNFIGLVSIALICAFSESTIRASDFDADRHAQYCGCGTKCRREKCCCGPVESPVQSDSPAEETNSDEERATAVRTFRNYICRIVSPCGTDADAPGSKVFRSFVPVAAVILVDITTDDASGRLIRTCSMQLPTDDFVSGVDRPPEPVIRNSLTI